MRWIFCALLVLSACDGSSRDDTDQPTQLAGPYDGMYQMVFQRAGGQYAIGAIGVEHGRFDGEARSAGGLEVHAMGRVAPDGTLVVDSMTNNLGVDITLVEGAIRDGVVEGTYSIDGEEGVFAGSLGAELHNQEPTREFDGTWEISTEVEDEETASFVVDIQRGRFRTTVVDYDELSFSVAGFVTSDGTIVLREASGELGVLMAEASVDQDTFEIEGIYRAGDEVGRIHGRKGD